MVSALVQLWQLDPTGTVQRQHNYARTARKIFKPVQKILARVNVRPIASNYKRKNCTFVNVHTLAEAENVLCTVSFTLCREDD